MNLGFFIGGCLASLISLGLLIGAIMVYVRQGRQAAGRVSVKGTVVSLEKRSTNPGSAGMYYPMIEYSLPNGETVRFESAFGTMPASYKIGQSVTALYNPSDPREAEVSSLVSRYLYPGIMAFIGLVTLCLGGFFLLFAYFRAAIPSTP